MLSKTDFIQFLNCPKSLWLMQRKPEVYPEGEFSEYAKKLAAEGYLVEDYVRQLVQGWPDAAAYSFQDVFETDEGLYARADMLRANEDGTVDIFEIKSSTSVKDSNPHNQLKDAAFQTIVATETGREVRNIFIVHLNKDYVRNGAIDPAGLLTFADETARVKGLLAETERQIADALGLLNEAAIDESSCSCLNLSRSHHCDSFDYFNPGIPKYSIYSLPRLSGKKLENFVSEGRFGLDQIELDEVTLLQQPIIQAHNAGAPYVDLADIENFISVLEYPLYFLDYETYASAIPIVDGTGPQEQLPFQFSLHVLHNDGRLNHFEYLVDQPEPPRRLVEALEGAIGATGSVVAWNKAFENTRNKEMAEAFPDKADFLVGLVERTVDLMDVFKTGYVDIRFNGSTSIKKVLPVVVPELSYEEMEIADGTAAMDGWNKMINEEDPEKRAQLRKALLAYCELDTLAMVRIFQFAETLIRDR
ncbi:hypothetical protein SIAM614_15490 [Stappia aggregata IAM 12614]|uniref:DUF2779 domain-containing protein n=1 Tax=Roseibium aggregatum (strain ATCC 25650 / DSM 13394 / JCM 20685 / NBRC 16684 / NCIMB 2208 / IAM 12614 / B1) TaxID=384765 RepID=A0NTD3_ROSAI|nr:DUF2779 domain-containing protein [Roseibium aggregatum]EAV44215.1 hypothetical protein SIAM614_15490 [Stappia aggregata IAM 12614] [Roseibium aggregatum IAM 12614]